MATDSRPSGDASGERRQVVSELIFDSVTLEKLRHVNERMEIRDQKGELIGYFSPRIDRSLYDSVDIPVDDDELRRRAQKGDGRTLTEILAELERRA
jgi:hypothetical protein